MTDVTLSTTEMGGENDYLFSFENLYNAAIGPQEHI
jgi:hypothetical protein